MGIALKIQAAPVREILLTRGRHRPRVLVQISTCHKGFIGTGRIRLHEILIATKTGLVGILTPPTAPKPPLLH